MARKKPVRKTNSLVDEVAKLPDADPLELGQLRREAAKYKAEAKYEQEARHRAEQKLAELTSTVELFQDLPKPKRKRLRRPAKKAGGKTTAMMLFTDWHAEENIDPETINNLNEYTLDIASRRISTAFKKQLRMLDLASHHAPVEDIVVWFGGDLINGAIHAEAEQTNFLGQAEAIEWVQDQIAPGLDLLLRETKLPIRIVCNRGNHGRSTFRKQPSNDYRSSWEWALYRQLARVYRQESRVDWIIGKGYHNIVNVQERLVRFHHGDGLKYRGGVGGLTIPANKAIDKWDSSVPCYLDIFGHYHTRFLSRKFISVGCLCGYNSYANEVVKAEYAPPSQEFAVIDKDYGLTMSLEVFVEPPRVASLVA